MSRPPIGTLVVMLLALSAAPVAAQPAAQAKPAAPASDGAKLFDDWACGTCHGLDRKGSENAPPLADLPKYWNADTLAEYLKDPQKQVAATRRLKEYKKTYIYLDMPPFDKPLSERKALAAWLLAQPSPPKK